MELSYKGSNCVVIATKKSSIVVDPVVAELNAKDYSDKGAICLLTHADFTVPVAEETLVFDCPGEYEVADTSIKGIAAREYGYDKTSPRRLTMYRIESGGVSAVFMGNIHPELSEDELEAIGMVDVLSLPLGGKDYALEPASIIKLIRAIEPKIVMPIHYAEKEIPYAVAQLEIDALVKELSAIKEQVSKLKLKAGSLPEALTVYEVTRTA